MNFDDSTFTRFSFTQQQIKKNLTNALRDFDIAKKDSIVEVKFNYSYNAFIKAGIALLSYYQVKIKSVPGHHVKIIEKMAEILKDEMIDDVGNVMRSKRNIDFYGGGIEITEKECNEYMRFVEGILKRIKDIITSRTK
jgi:uncharacterized protein (UPF0332 family)